MCCKRFPITVVNFSAHARLQNPPQALAVPEFVVQIKLSPLSIDDADKQNEKQNAADALQKSDASEVCFLYVKRIHGDRLSL